MVVGKDKLVSKIPRVREKQHIFEIANKETSRQGRDSLIFCDAGLTLWLQEGHAKGEAGNHGPGEDLGKLVRSFGENAAQVSVAEADDPVVLLFVLPDKGGLVEGDPLAAPLKSQASKNSRGITHPGNLWEPKVE